MSSVWDFAIKIKNPVTKSLEGKCKTCHKIIKCSGNSTTTLKNHLKTHGIDLDNLDEPETSEPTAKKQKLISNFLIKKSLKEIVSDMATDGISIRAITRNQFIRQSIQREGLKLPANESAVMKLVHDDFEEKRNKLIDIIKSKIADGKKFSVTVDEVTTLKGRRYFGVNLHESSGKETFKTGLIRIYGSCSALDMVEIMEKHLLSFGVSIAKDIVGSTQDGAAVNKKYIRHIPAIGQLCLNHGIHLGVCDTLYKKKTANVDILTVSDEENEDDFENGLDIEIVSDVEDEVDYHEILKNARKLVKFIKLSTVRNHIFQSKNMNYYGREIELHLDVKTRWNSIPSMLKPLIATEQSIRETLNEFKAQEMIENINFGDLRTLLDAMEPIKIAVENLSKENATLLSADTIIKFMMDKLENLQSEIAGKLFQNLKLRIDERWNYDLMSLLRSLNDPNHTPTRQIIIYAGELANRLFGVHEEQVPETTVNNEEPLNMSLQDELNILLEKNSSALSSGVDPFKWLKSEFTLFKNTGQRTENLQKLYDAILSIRPTSTDVERVFSVVASFCTKIRSRLSDKSLCALVFLKYFYNKMNKK